jgi:threonine dehydrogenase-like Zn-dependent dehydrogenase
MTGLWLEAGRLRLREDLAAPDPPAGEAVVRVLRAGICGTDLEMLRGYASFTGVPGHEFVGVVERGSEALRGRRVVGEINAACGSCPACRAGRRTHCPSRTVLGIAGRHGAFAQLLALPEANLHPVPEGLGTDAAVFTEPLAAALQIQEQVPIRPEDRVVVFGDGRLGQLVARTLVPTGCDLLVAGKHASKLDLLARIGIPTRHPDAVPGRSFDVAVECTGGAVAFAAALGALRPRGTLVMKSTYAGSLSLPPAALVVDEITLVGSRCGPFAPALRLLAAGKVDVTPLIEARYPLAEGPAAFEHAAGALKVLLDVEASG